MDHNSQNRYRSKSAYWVVGLLLLIAIDGMGQSTVSILGQVSDHKTGEVLPGVNIQILGTQQGTTTDLEGRYSLSELKPGVYALKFSMIGYIPHVEESFELTQGESRELDVELKPNILSSPQVVVTSTRKDEDILDSPFSVSAIGPREIQAKAIINTVDILSYEPGVSTIKGQLNIRGASGYTLGAGSRSLLLVDGIPLMGSAAGNITWQTIPTSEVDRIEIVKSGGSAMYGSSAMGGVVNVITRNAPPQTETRVSSQVGIYSQPRVAQWQWRDHPGLLYDLEMSHSRNFGPHAAWLRIQKRSNDGFLALNWEQATNLSSKVKFNFNTSHSAALFINVLKDRSGLLSTWKSPADPFEAPLGSEDDYTAGTKTVVNGHYNYLHSPQLSLKLKASVYRNRWDGFGADPDFSNEQREFLEISSTRNWSEKISSVAGISLQSNHIKAQIFGNHDSRSEAAYLQVQGQQGPLRLTLGGRGEVYLVDGEEMERLFAPQLAINYRVNPGLSMRASTARGFRVPTVAEMFTRAHRSIFLVEPNPDLVSETSVSREIGVSFVMPSRGIVDLLKIDAAIFRNQFENLIEPTPDSLAIIHFENISRARISGADIGIGLSLWENLVDLRTAYTWLDPVSIDDGGSVLDTLAYRTRHHWISTLGIHLLGFDAAVEYRYASKLDRVQLFPENELTGQDEQVPVNIWNASLGRSWGRWVLTARVNNIFQYYYTQLERNMAEERVMTLTVERRL